MNSIMHLADAYANHRMIDGAQDKEASQQSIKARAALDAAVTKLERERDAALEACELVDKLIEHQYTGASKGMTALTVACDACHDALKGEQG